jgi:hypothetical protein
MQGELAPTCDAEEPFYALCCGHHFKITGEFSFTARPLDEAHMHAFDGGVVVNVPCMEIGTTIYLAPGAVLSHPINVHPVAKQEEPSNLSPCPGPNPAAPPTARPCSEEPDTTLK